MGLDTVELLMGFEEEFGIEIPDEVAERLTTVRELHDYLSNTLILVEPMKCLSQKIFYKLRRGLIEIYKLQRKDITPNTLLSELVSYDQLQDGWPYLEMFIEMRTPSFEVSNKLLGFTLSSRTLNMEELVQSLIKLNPKFLVPDDRPEIHDIYRRIVDVTVRQLNVNREEVHMDASWTKDLGAD